jgi:hypothetical protein
MASALDALMNHQRKEAKLKVKAIAHLQKEKRKLEADLKTINDAIKKVAGGDVVNNGATTGGNGSKSLKPAPMIRILKLIKDAGEINVVTLAGLLKQEGYQKADKAKLLATGKVESSGQRRGVMYRWK